MKEIRQKKNYRKRFDKKSADSGMGFYVFLIILFIGSYIYFSNFYFA